jgi:hypothetical protein
MPLGEILGAAKSHGRHLVLAEIIFNGEPLKGGERSHNKVDLIALNQLDRFSLGCRRNASGIGHNKFDLSSRQREVFVFQKTGDPFFKMNASSGEPAGFHGYQPDLDRVLLRDGWSCHLRDCGSRAA